MFHLKWKPATCVCTFLDFTVCPVYVGSDVRQATNKCTNHGEGTYDSCSSCCWFYFLVIDNILYFCHVFLPQHPQKTDCIGNEEHLWIYSVVMLFQISRPWHVCNRTFFTEKMVEPCFCFTVTSLKAEIKLLLLFSFSASRLQVNEKVNYNFRREWLDWH